MCLLIVLNGIDRDYPIVVAGNRDEIRTRASSPPGLWADGRRRVLSPRDKEAGGTWLGVNDAGLVAGLTNLAGAPPRPDAPSRGHLPHLALEHATVAAAADAVAAAVAATPYRGFQLVIADGAHSSVLAWDGAVLARDDGRERVITISNEHRFGELRIPALATAAETDLATAERLDRLAALLLDTGGESGHRVLKTGGDYGTVSSSLLAVKPADARALIWRYAAGSPDAVPYRNYGNLARRLVEG